MLFLQRGLCIGVFLLVSASVCASQTDTGTEKPHSSTFAAAVSYAQSLAQWELAIMGGSLLVVVGSSHHRPSVRGVRAFYLLFLPGWICLGISIWFSTRVQGAYMAYLAFRAADFEGTVRAVNADMISQNWFMLAGLFCFFIWLVVYLIWWTFAEEANFAGSKS